MRMRIHIETGVSATEGKEKVVASANPVIRRDLWGGGGAAEQLNARGAQETSDYFFFLPFGSPAVGGTLRAPAPSDWWRRPFRNFDMAADPFPLRSSLTGESKTISTSSGGRRDPSPSVGSYGRNDKIKDRDRWRFALLLGEVLKAGSFGWYGSRCDGGDIRKSAADHIRSSPKYLVRISR
jgi:hypothetical protein